MLSFNKINEQHEELHIASAEFADAAEGIQCVEFGCIYIFVIKKRMDKNLFKS